MVRVASNGGMMQLTVWKYQIKAQDYFEVDMPSSHKILSVQEQEKNVNLWALVDPGSTIRRVRFRLAGTGHAISEDENQLNYIGTFQLNNGLLVFHLFEIVPFLIEASPA